MKLRAISVVAASAILGLGLLSGCGSSGGGSVAGAVASGISASDGYVIKLDTNATAFCSDTNTTYTSLATVGARGALTFPGVTLTNTCTVSVPADAWIDADNSGDYNKTLDKQVGFVMKAPGNAKYVSHLTTLAVESNNTALMDYVKDFDPVLAAEAATSDNNATAEKAKKLLILGEAVKTALSGGSITEAAKINVTDILDVNKSVSDINTTAMTANLGGTVKTAVDAKIVAMEALVEILDDLKDAGVDITDAVVQISDGGKTLAQSVGDANITEVNTTAVTNAITTATTAVTNLPAKLTVSSLKLGSQTVAINGNSFNTTVDTATASIEDFYNVSFPSVALTKGFTEKTVGVSVKISDANSNQVTLAIAGAKLTPNDTNSSVKIALPTTATVSFSETGLSALQTALGATSASTPITTALTPNDLAFNVETILGSISSSSKIADGIAALDTYLKASGVYDVNISFSGLSGDLTTDYTSFVGKVTVKGDVTAPTAPTLGDVNATSLVVTAEAGSTIKVKNAAGTTLATATATGSAQTLTFTALTATTALSVTATDRYGNVSTAATTTFTYTAPATPFTLDATYFNNTKVVATGAGDTVTFNFYDDGNVTESSVLDGNSTGTWAIVTNKLKVTYGTNDYVEFTFTKAPAALDVVSVYDYTVSDQDTFNVTIQSIGAADARNNVNTGSCEVEDMFGNTAPGTYVNGVCVAN